MIKWIIFDMDWVISDTQKLHSRVESDILTAYWVNMSPEEITRKYSWVRTSEMFDEILTPYTNDYDLDKISKEKRIKMEQLANQSVDPIPWSQNLIKMLYSEWFPLVVASASKLKYVKTVLDKLEISSYFTDIVSWDMVSKWKPDPECFLLAASKINVLPENCLVIEDWISGMIWAKDWGMYCIWLVPEINESYPTNNLVTSLSEITLEYINNLKK